MAAFSNYRFQVLNVVLTNTNFSVLTLTVIVERVSLHDTRSKSKQSIIL